MNMDARDKTQVLDALERGRQAFLDALHGLPEDLAARSPAPGRWSALECAEHVAVSEDFLFSRLMEAQTAGTPVVNQQRDAGILARGAGRFSAVADAIRRFSHSRAETVRFVENSAEDLRARLTTHPLLGLVNGYETLLLMAVHPRRHARQIDEIGAALRQP